MRKTTIALVITIALIAGMPLAAQTGAQQQATGQATSRFPGIVDIDYRAWDIGKPGGSFTFSQLSDPKSFNVITAGETSSTYPLAIVYDGIVSRDPLTLEFQPYLAERWVTSADGLSATFYMKRNLKWSDGHELTAEDAVFTVNEIILNEKVNTNSRDAFRVGDSFMKIELVDKYTFKVTLPSQYAGLLNTMSFAPVPKHIFEPLIKEKGIEAVNSFQGVDTDVTKIVGSGPYLFEQYVPAQKIVFKKNPNYWMKDARGQQLPYIDRITVLIVDNLNTMALKFQSKEIEYFALRGQDVATFLPKKRDLGIELWNAGPAAGSTFLVLNENPASSSMKEPLLTWANDKRFRKALAHLVDKETIVNNVQFGFGFPQDSFIPPYSPYYWQGAPDAVPQYDPEAAKKILDEMDLKDRNGDGIREDARGNRVAFNLITNSGNTVREAVGNMIAREAKNVGIDITFKPGDFNTMVGSLTNPPFDWQGIVIGLTGSVDPISGANVYPSSGNFHMIEPRQESPRRDWEKEVDRWWDYANLTLDEAKRKEGFMHIQQIWLDQLPWIFTTNAAFIAGYSTKLGNAKLRPPLSDTWSVIQWMYVK